MSSNPGGPQTDPSIRPTSPSVLVVAALAAAAVGWLLLSAFYEHIDVPWLPIIVIGALAVIEGILAQNTAARIQRRPGAGPVDGIAIARYVVLAKASALTASLYGGYSLGLLAWLALEPTKQARDDIPAAIAAVAAALALVATALWLEHSCRVPEQPDRKDDTGPGRP